MVGAVTVDAFLALLKDVSGSEETGWSACCPAHEDDRASLSIGLGEDGRILVRCHAGAGCPMESIVAAVGKTPADLFAREIGGTYDYLDEKGALLYEVVRFVPKEFRQRRPDGNGG